MEIHALLTNGISKVLWWLQITVRALWSPAVLGANGIIIDERGMVLLVRHSYRAGWSLPGGGVERGEAPQVAVLRELAEEVGLQGGETQFFGLYVRRVGWVTNVNALFRVTGGVVKFKPSWEIREVLWVDPAAPPRGTSAGTRRRLAELMGSPISPFW
jgi:8-oxo-dGTP pyrophosphatase MutT (NUDIX family)